MKGKLEALCCQNMLPLADHIRRAGHGYLATLESFWLPPINPFLGAASAASSQLLGKTSPLGEKSPFSVGVKVDVKHLG